MASWILIPCLKLLFAEFNAIAPARDTASDGAVADEAHREAGTSDHIPDEEAAALRDKDADKVNEVHAIDVDDDLRESDLTMEKVVQFLLGRCRSGAEKRLRYIIYNRRIWSASSGWVQKTYTGASAHTEHAHFSASYATNLEASTASWHLEDIPVALTADDKTWITSTVKAQVSAGVASILNVIEDELGHLPAAVLGEKIGDKANAGRTAGDVLRDVAKLRGLLIGDVKDSANAALSPTSPLAHIIAAAGDTEAILDKLNDLTPAS